MKKIFFRAVPFDKGEVTLALESGVDAVITESEHLDAVRTLSKIPVLDAAGLEFITLRDKSDEEEAARQLAQGRTVILREGWEIIPVENILAQSGGLAVEAENLDRARLAAGILERGVDTIVVTPRGAADLKNIVRELRLSQGVLPLETATITAVTPAGLGHRVCVDTMTLMRPGQGMLVGNSSAFTFLVNAETETNPYVAPRPFRVNAGAVHAYAVMPGDRTAYLEELRAGTEILLTAADGSTTLATIGRCKTEIRPMLLIEARCGDRTGAIFLQNAETIRLVRDDGSPVSVVHLAEGDTVLVRTDRAGRHFGMRIDEDIRE